MATQIETTHPVTSYQTAGGIRMTRRTRDVCADVARAQLLRALDTRRGMLLASSFEYPGRYKRYDYGFVDPPLALEAGGLSRTLQLTALNRRGQLLLPGCHAALLACDALLDVTLAADSVQARVREPEQAFAEEDRTRAPNVLSAVRALVALFHSPEDNLLGLYGAFGHDLVFQFESLTPRLERPDAQRDLVLYLPDELLVIDHDREQARSVAYDFEVAGHSSAQLPREQVFAAQATPRIAAAARDHAPGEYAELVTRARAAFACGDLFEVTPGQRFEEPCSALPSRLFTLLREANPAPYGFCANLGDGAHLIGASPEMYVRVSGRRVETCPIAGTIARGSDALADAAQILKLLTSEKEASELTMCTDVDRNDKARICEPGSVRVIGRRQVELYSRLIHTVDHVEGRLREGYDAIDAFLTHMWAVTVTGAPKQNALQFIEDHERSVRGFYGGAIGALRFDGSMDTGLVLRTIALQDGVATGHTSTTLLFDSDPAAEEQETELKASAVFAALRAARQPSPAQHTTSLPPTAAAHAPLRVLLIDHRDSFVHTLGDYFRQLDCHVTTLRFDRALAQLDRLRPELVVLSPGPSRPDDFGMRDTLAVLERSGVSVFGVCLGLQGMVEYCGGQLHQLELPKHGKASEIRCSPGALFEGLPERFTVGRYHSLYAYAHALPSALSALAVAEQDGSCMALAHRDLPWSAVQFHPESILSAHAGHGLTLLRNVVEQARRHQRQGRTLAAV
jgi:anthranilate synthase